MRSLGPLLFLTALAATADLLAQPLDDSPDDSRTSSDEDMCVACHSMEALWLSDPPHPDDRPQLYVPADRLAEDVHWAEGIRCHDCHGGDPSKYDPTELHLERDGFRNLFDVRQTCADCHKEHAVGGVHGEVGHDLRTPLGCMDCHAGNPHHILPVDDARSAVHALSQVKTCGGCHEPALETYQESIHGQALGRPGPLLAATCADCHGAHDVSPAAEESSSLHADNVTHTCGQCHPMIQEALDRSVHGSAHQPDPSVDATDQSTAGPRRPICTDCHQRHDVQPTGENPFRLDLPNRCGNCHANLSSRYAMSLHGELTELGYGPAAKCADCHGSHAVRPMSDPQSLLSSANRPATCGKCHSGVSAASRFVDFDPHADHRDPARNPVLYWVYLGLMTLIVSVFGFFGLHSLLWFVRGLLHVVKHGRPKGLTPGTAAYRRFGPFHRAAHAVMLVCFLGLALTGLPLKYSHSEWAKTLADALGGFESTSVWHRHLGLVIFACFFVYLVRMARKYRSGRRGATRRDVVFGPDSPVPNFRDLKDLGRMGRWFFGLGPKPTVERWSYWEKFDFWGACADVFIIGVTGLILWFPGPFCTFLPGSAINVAKLVHSTQALLATGFVFAIHFFNTHVRAEKFPADLSVLTGLVSEEELREERPELYQRLLESGKLAELRGTVPSAAQLWLYRLAGLLALVVGLGLLAGMIVAGLGG